MIYGFWVCAGCDTGTLETAWTSVAMRDEHGEYQDTFTYDPPRTTSALAIRRFRQIPQGVAVIYDEVIQAYNHGLHVLCAAGLRALIEGVCADKGIKGRLEEQINGLDKLLHADVVKNLHGFRFMGNDAVHELNAPSAKDLGIAIEVSEDVLNYLYDLDYKSRQLPKKPPHESSQ